MSLEIIIVLAVLLISIILFITELIRVDLVAILIMMVLLFTKILSPTEALAGFSNEGTLTIAFMFVLSQGLFRTGVVVYLGRTLSRVFKLNRFIANFTFIGVVGLISAFTNNTPVVAIFIPILLQVAKEEKISASKLLLPLSYASIIGGVTTLIGTSTNLVVNSVAQKYGQPAFSLFEITGAGVFFFAVGAIYLLFIGIPLIPNRRTDADLANSYGLGDYITEIELQENSASINVPMKDSFLVKNLSVDILEIVRGEERIFLPPPNTILRARDVLRVKCEVDKIKEMQEKAGIEIKPGLKWKDQDFVSPKISLVEAIIAPHSFLEGKTLKQADFRARFGVTVLGIRHRGRFMQDHVADTHLQAGDALLMEAEVEKVETLKGNNSFMLVSEVDAPTFKKLQIVISVFIMIAVVTTASLEIFPIAVSALIGCALLIVTNSLTLDQAYRSIDWQIIILLVGTLALGTALEKTGAAKLMSDLILSGFGQYGPYVVLSAFYIITVVLTEFMSNTATAALITPIAIVASNSLGIDPRPLLVTVMFGASLAFMSPVGYQTHLMVYNPGRYKYSDFLKVGTPLNIIFWILATFIIPIFFPFYK